MRSSPPPAAPAQPAVRYEFDEVIVIVLQLADIRRRIGNYAKSAILRETTQPTESATLLAEISALRPETSSLRFESSSGPASSVAGHNAAAALVAQLHAAWSLNVLPVTADMATSERIARALERNESTLPSPTVVVERRHPRRRRYNRVPGVDTQGITQKR